MDDEGYSAETLEKQLKKVVQQNNFKSLTDRSYHSAVLLSFNSQRPAMHLTGDRDIYDEPLCFSRIGFALEHAIFQPHQQHPEMAKKNLDLADHMNCTFESPYGMVPSAANKSLKLPISGSQINSEQYCMNLWNSVGPNNKPGFGVRTLFYRYALFAFI